MVSRRLSRISILAAAALALQGCIAAAIPLAAGGLMVRGVGAADRKAKPAQPEALVIVEAPAAPEAANTANIARVDMKALPPADRDARALTLADVMPEGTASAELQPLPRRPGLTGSYDPFAPLFAYASDLPQREGGALPSAMLRDPASLRPQRAECAAGPAAVLFDLDPEGGLFDPEAAVEPAREIAAELARLRNAGLAIAWISGHSAAMAADIRAALERAELDPENADRLILLRYPSDRKQTRRREFARDACVVAIAGDSRADFDELFEYVTNPASTALLEPLIGRGWFLVPPLFPAQGSKQ